MEAGIQHWKTWGKQPKCNQWLGEKETNQELEHDAREEALNNVVFWSPEWRGYHGGNSFVFFPLKQNWGINSYKLIMGLIISLSLLWPRGRDMVLPLVVVIYTLFLHKQNESCLCTYKPRLLIFQVAFGQTTRGICKVLQAVFICSILDTS